MQRTLLIASLAVVVVLLGVARASAALQLDGDAYVQVHGYRYVEAQRFERGWNRGADVVAVGGAVRAPVAGRVRFAGTVAGRGVVTIEAVVDGEPVVVTLTGVDAIAVREGGVVDAGGVVGRGLLVHVGAYDPARRTRYVPVVVRARALGTRDDGGAGARGAVHAVGDAVVRRLGDAIEGRTGGGVADATSVRVNGWLASVSARMGSAVPSRSAVASADRAARAALAYATGAVAATTSAPGARVPASRVQRDALRNEAPHVAPHAMPSRADEGTVRGSPVRPRQRPVDLLDGMSVAHTGEIDDSAAAGAVTPRASSPQRSANVDGGDPQPVLQIGEDSATRSAPRSTPPQLRAHSGTGSQREGRTAITWRDATAAAAAGLTACLLLIPLLRRRRCRHRSARTARTRVVVHPPRDPLLPTPSPCPAPSPHEPIEWTDAELRGPDVVESVPVPDGLRHG